MCFTVQTCCFCNSVATGTRWIAVTSLVLCGLALLGGLSEGDLSGIVSAVVGGVVAGMLYQGQRTQNKCLVLVWLVVTMIQIVLLAAGCVLMVFLFITGLADGQRGAEAQLVPIVAAVFYAIFVVLYAHFWSVVYSFYQGIQGDEEQGQGKSPA